MEFEEMYTEYFSIVYSYVLSLSHDSSLAEELTQETFFKALKRIDTFKQGTNEKAWLCQIAKNLFFDHSKRAGKLACLDETFTEDVQQELCSDIEEAVCDKELSIRIHKILHKMEEPYKEVFCLRVFGELSFSEIGDIFDKSDGWARVTYFRARKKIREEIGNEYQL